MDERMIEIDYSVIIPICHGGRFLRDALASLKAIDFSPDRFEVLVAGLHNDGESREMVHAAAKDAPFDLKYIDCADSGRSHLMNRACGAARGGILAFADDDAVFKGNWLKEIGAAFSNHPDIGIVGGPDQLEQHTTAFCLALDHILNSFPGTGGLRGGTGPRVGKYYPKLWNMAVPAGLARDVALKSEKGPPLVFNESISVHEDVELADRIERAGKRILFEPRMHIGHKRDTTYVSFACRNFKMAQVCRMFRIHPLPHLFLSTFALGLPVAVFSLIVTPSPGRAVLLAFFFLYLMVLLASGAQGFKRTKSVGVFFWSPWLLLTLHLSRGLGYLWPAGKKSAAWLREGNRCIY